MKKLKIVFYPSIERISKKTQQIPMYLRISRGSTKTEVRLPVHIAKSEFDDWDETLQRMSVNSDVNVEIDKIKHGFNGLCFTHKDRYDKMTPQEVKSVLFHYDGQLMENSNLIEKIKEYFQKTVKSNGNIVEGTVRNYKKSITHFENYLKYEKKSHISILEFNPLLAHRFYEYLQKGIPEIGKKYMQGSSASGILQKIKVIFNYWVDTEIIRRNPFKKVNLLNTTKKKEELSTEDVKKLIAYDFSNEPNLDMYRDLFLFQIYTGLAYGDVYKLLKNQIEVMGNGDVVFCRERNKTSVEIRQMLNSRAIEILKKYEGHIEVMCFPNRLLPRKHLNPVNLKLKIIQAKVGITKLLSTHIARHTCAQFIAESGVPYDVMDKMMGWKNNKQGTRAIYYRVSDIMLRDAKLKYETFLNQNL